MFTRSVFLAAVVVAAAICGGELDILHAAFDRTAADVVFACTANAQVANCDRNYTVVAGDFCDGISAKENVSTCVPLSPSLPSGANTPAGSSWRR